MISAAEREVGSPGPFSPCWCVPQEVLTLSRFVHVKNHEALLPELTLQRWWSQRRASVLVNYEIHLCGLS